MFSIDTEKEYWLRMYNFTCKKFHWKTWDILKSFQAIYFSLQRKYPISLRFGQSILRNLSSQATSLYATAPKQHCAQGHCYHLTCFYPPVLLFMLACVFFALHAPYPVAQYISTCWYSKVWYFISQLGLHDRKLVHIIKLEGFISLIFY